MTPTPWSTDSTRCPPDERPPVAVVRNAFQVMVAIGFGLLALGAWFAIAWWRRRDPPASRWFHRAAVVAGFAAPVALEAGWIVTEVGRQPWIVWRVMRVSEAVTTAPNIRLGLYFLIVVYALLTWGTIFVLRRLSSTQQEDIGAVTSAEALLAFMWVGVTAYALSGGADFGAGFWDLVAGGPQRGAASRKLIEHAIGPVWEANHVWLIFVLVVLWTGFPEAFAAIASSLYVPLTLVAVGVILRGAGFAFRKAVTGVALERLFGATFAASSVITPFFLGTVAGRGGIGAGAGRDRPGPSAAQLREPHVGPRRCPGRRGLRLPGGGVPDRRRPPGRRRRARRHLPPACPRLGSRVVLHRRVLGHLEYQVVHVGRVEQREQVGSLGGGG